MESSRLDVLLVFSPWASLSPGSREWRNSSRLDVLLVGRPWAALVDRLLLPKIQLASGPCFVVGHRKLFVWGVWQMPRMCLHVWAGNSGHWWMSGGNPSPLCPVSPSACLGILCRRALETDLSVPDLHRSSYTMCLNTEATKLKRRYTDEWCLIAFMFPPVHLIIQGEGVSCRNKVFHY